MPFPNAGEVGTHEAVIHLCDEGFSHQDQIDHVEQPLDGRREIRLPGPTSTIKLVAPVAEVGYDPRLDELVTWHPLQKESLRYNPACW